MVIGFYYCVGYFHDVIDIPGLNFHHFVLVFGFVVDMAYYHEAQKLISSKFCYLSLLKISKLTLSAKIFTIGLNGSL